jgi:hypothetical protein
VYGVGAVVIGNDRSEVLGGSVFGATACLVDDGVAAMGVLVGFIGDSGVDGEVVFIAGAGHADIGHSAAGPIGHVP